jgi:hypothetical protein
MTSLLERQVTSQTSLFPREIGLLKLKRHVSLFAKSS